MEKRFLTKVLAIVVSFGLTLQPLCVFAAEPPVTEEMQDTDVRSDDVELNESTEAEGDADVKDVDEEEDSFIEDEPQIDLTTSAISVQNAALNGAVVLAESKNSDNVPLESIELTTNWNEVFVKGGEIKNLEVSIDNPKDGSIWISDYYSNWEKSGTLGSANGTFTPGSYSYYISIRTAQEGLLPEKCKVIVDGIQWKITSWGTSGMSLVVKSPWYEIVDDSTGSEDKNIIESVEAKSDWDSVLAVGLEVKPLSFNNISSKAVAIEGMYWEKEQNKAWASYEGSIFTAGTYRYMVKAKILDEYKETDAFDKGLKFSVDNIQWRALGAIDEDKIVFISNEKTINPPESEKTVISKISATSDISDVLKAGAEFKMPSFKVEGDDPIKIDGYEYRKLGSNGYYSKYNESSFVAGTYNLLVIVKVTDDNYELGDEFSLTIDGQEWTNYGYYHDDDGWTYKAYYKSPELEIAEQITPVEMTTVSSVSATSNINQVFIDKGEVNSLTVTASEQYIEITYGDIYKIEDDGGGIYGAMTFEPGTYCIPVIVSVPQEYKDKYTLKEDMALYVDGQKWIKNSTKYWGNEVVSITFMSPRIEIKSSTKPVFQNVRIENGILYWDAIDGARSYSLVTNDKEMVTIDTSYNLKAWFNIIRENTPDFKYGTYTISITALDTKLVSISEPYTVEYTFLESDSNEILKVEATSNMSEKLVYGASVDDLEFEVKNGTPVSISSRYWLSGNQRYTDDVFKAGTYTQKIVISIINTDEYKWGLNPEAIIDGQQWYFRSFEYDDTYKVTGAYFESPEFEITEQTTPVEKKKISSAIVTSNYDQILKYGEEIQHPSFEAQGNDPITIKGVWIKKENDNSEHAAIGNADAGLYYCMVNIQVVENSEAYELDEDFKLTINGTDWESVSENKTDVRGLLFKSENIKVTAPVVNPEPQPEPSPQPGPTPGPSPQPTPGPVSNTSSNSNAITPVTIVNPQTPTTGAASDVKTTSSTLSSTTQKSNTQNTEAPAVDQESTNEESTNEETPVQESEPAENEQITDPETPLARTEDPISESVADSENSNLVLIVIVALLAAVGIEEFIRRMLKNRV